ncbi:MAG: DUF3857 domain-containing protein [Prevotella sp.]|nr:DUF3857 domain-containing protein [Prevotella sp.]
MNSTILKPLLTAVLFFVCAAMADAQLPNEKFGKPSSMEWDYVGWNDCSDADAIILYKSMKVTYQISDQVSTNYEGSDVSYDNLADFGKNQIDNGSILVNYEFNLRVKILKPEGKRHADVDITYFNADNDKTFNRDELEELKVRVFTRNEKGKVVKKNVDTRSFVSERINDSYMVIHVVVPEAEAGSIVEYTYKITSYRPAFLYDWVFQESIPTLRTKCDIDIPAFLQFNMNVPIHQLIKPSVEVGRLAYDQYRPDMKRAKTFPTNHYIIVGDYILPEDHAFRSKKDSTADNDESREKPIAPFTSKLTTPHDNIPAPIPEGHTHLKVK